MNRFITIYLLIASVLLQISYGFAPRSILPRMTSLAARTTVSMVSGARGGGGATKLDRKTSTSTSTKPSYKEEIEKDWRLVLHDDSIHTIQQVVEILSTVCPLCPGARAYEVTLECHMTGAGTVAVANKKIIQEYCKSLQVAGLSMSMSPDDEFQSDGDDEEEE